MPNSSRLGAWWRGFFERHPRLAWVRTWGISIASVVMGLVTLLVFRRGVEYFPVFIGYLLLLWLAGVVFAGARKNLAGRVPRALSAAIDYTVQTLLHGLLLFLVPIYYASTTVSSGNVWLLVALVAAAILTTIDPWYRAVMARAPWTEVGLFWVGLFASLNAALPLIGMPGEWVLLLGGGASVLSLLPAVRQHLRISMGSAVVRVTLGAVLFGAGVWWARAWIPPVPLYLTRATFARAVEDLEPIEPVARVSDQELRAWGLVAVFTAISAPSGLSEPIYHVWRKNGRTVGEILLTTIRGGRPGGFRTYSWKTDLGLEPAGVWQVDVRTVHGQLVGRVRLLVTAS
jgi:Family of unknown function (DUF5924)/Protein of unknown function (DUF2914)